MFARLSMLPSSCYPFIWSDFIELQTLAKADKCFSEEEFIALLLSDQACTYTHTDAKALWGQLIEHCENRVIIYSGHYPFAVNGDRTVIALKLVLTHPKQRLYLGMLIAASRLNVPLQWHDQLTHDFADVCYQLFNNLMPTGTQIQRLPASTQQFPPYEQIQYMARMTRGRVLCEPQDFDLQCVPQSCAQSETSPAALSGVVDMLAWHSMGDERDGIPVSIARCACDGDYLMSTQHTLLNLATQFYMRHPWSSYLFSPLDLYTVKKDWALKHQLGRVILLDRYRILNLAEEFFIYNDVPDIDHIDLLYRHY